MPDNFLTINKEKIGLGEHKVINFDIASLPTRTSISLPVHVYRSQHKGSVLLLTGGLHGDELNGVEIIRRMIESGDLIPDFGTVIAIPIVNIYGFIQNSRGLPDGKDINRSFPGIKKGGSLAKLLAYTLMKNIIPHIDYGIDFHTGGASRSNFPQIRVDLTNEKALEKDDPNFRRNVENSISPVTVVLSTDMAAQQNLRDMIRKAIGIDLMK